MCAQAVATFVSCNKEASIPLFSEYLRTNPNDYYARYYRGRAYEITEMKDEAIADFNFLMQTSRGAERLVAQAKLIMLRQTPRDAANFLITNVIGQYPQSGLALGVLGEILVHEEGYDEAYPYLLQAVKIEHPRIGSAYRDLGFVYNERKDHQRAENCFRQALSRHETMTHAHIELAKALTGLGRAAEAKPHLTRASQLNPLVFSNYASIEFKTMIDTNPSNAKKVASLGGRKYFMPKEYGGQPNKSIWFVKDTAGHAQCRYKVYLERSGHLNFLYGADEFGERIPKHESMAGHRIPVKDLNVIFSK